MMMMMMYDACCAALPTKRLYPTYLPTVMIASISSTFMRRSLSHRTQHVRHQRPPSPSYLLHTIQAKTQTSVVGFLPPSSAKHMYACMWGRFHVLGGPLRLKKGSNARIGIYPSCSSHHVLPNLFRLQPTASSSILSSSTQKRLSWLAQSLFS